MTHGLNHVVCWSNAGRVSEEKVWGNPGKESRLGCHLADLCDEQRLERKNILRFSELDKKCYSLSSCVSSRL